MCRRSKVHSLPLLILPMVRLAHAWCPPPGPILPAPKVDNGSAQADPFSNLSFTAYNDTSFAIKATIGDTEIYRHAYTAAPYIDATRVDQYDTLTRIGSVTKLMTVLAILLSEDKIGWEESIQKYVPGLEGDIWKEVTISSLASHTSGLGRFGYVGDLAEIPTFNPSVLGIPPVNNTLPGCDQYPGGNVCTLPQLTGMFNSLSELPRSPNSGPLYSNNGYVLLGLALKNVYNQSYEDVIQRLIIDPLGLKNTTFVPPNSTSVAILPVGRDSWFVPDFANWNPTGGIWSTPNDLSKFMRSILDHKFLSPAQTRKWLQPRASLASLRQLVGAPWEIMRADSFNITSPRVIDIVTKAGGVTGYAAYGVLVPEYNLAITINAAGNSSQDALNEILPNLLNAFVPYADNLARQQAKVKYTGTYTLPGSSNGTSSITIDLDDGPGLLISSFNMSGVPILATFAALTSSDPTNFSARLYPTDPDTLGTGKEYWRITLESNDDDKGWNDDLCISWEVQDRFRYAGQPLDALNFIIDGDKATQVELLGWRSLLQRTDDGNDYS